MVITGYGLMFVCLFVCCLFVCLFVYYECPLEHQSSCATPGTQLGKSIIESLMWSELVRINRLMITSSSCDYRL